MKSDVGNTVLGIILCPVFDEELIHNLKGDTDISEIIVLTNQYSQGLCEKLSASELSFRMIPESEFNQDDISRADDGFTTIIVTNNLGLHAEPAALKAKVEEQILEMQPYTDVIGVYYGQCGNANWDISEWCRDNGLNPAVIYRDDDGAVCDDCACVLFESREKYMEVRERYGEEFYLTPGIAHHMEDFVESGSLSFTLDNIPEDQRDLFGIKTNLDVIRWIFSMGNIKASLKVDNGMVEPVAFDEEFDRISHDLNLIPIRLDKSYMSLKTVDHIYSECKRLLKESVDRTERCRP